MRSYPGMYHLALTVIFFVFCVTVIYGGISDITQYTIPNRVSYGLISLFAVYAAIIFINTPSMPHLGFYVTPMLWNVAYGLATFIFFFVFWRLGWLGGGDVKFVSAISFWMGPIYILLYVVLLGILSTGYVMLLATLFRWNPYFQDSHLPKIVKQALQKTEQKVVPYGVPAAIAAVAVAPFAMAQFY